MKVNIEHPNLKNRKSRVVVHEYDLWSTDRTMAMVIRPLVKKVIESLDRYEKGVPSSMMGNYDEDGSEEEYNRAFEEGRKRWRDVLCKIEWAMQEIISQRGHPSIIRPKGWSKKQWVLSRSKEPLPKEREEAIKGFGEKIREYYAKVQEGCELLGKYFQSLWT